jgi:hypothetical protein
VNGKLDWSGSSSDVTINIKTIRGLSPRENHTDRAIAACRLSYCQLLRIEGAVWSVWRIPTALISVL